jgi:hypothetical protein
MHFGQETGEQNVMDVVFRTCYSDLSSLVMFHVSKWFAANKLVLNLHKTNTIKFVASDLPHCALSICCKDNYTEVTVNTEHFG